MALRSARTPTWPGQAGGRDDRGSGDPAAPGGVKARPEPVSRHAPGGHGAEQGAVGRDRVRGQPAPPRIGGVVLVERNKGGEPGGQSPTLTLTLSLRERGPEGRGVSRSTG